MKIADLYAAHTDTALSAKLAGLMVSSPTDPGWSRVRSGKKNFSYRDEKGRAVRNPEKLARIDALRIPPAWKDVWICAKPKGHLQATGIDAKGIVQYRYHAKWSAFREIIKFHRLAMFATVLPKLRTEIHARLELEELSREKVIAAALELVDVLSLRIGSEGYAESNKTYGVTTLRTKHVSVADDVIELNFIGKSHQEHEYELTDKRLANVLTEELALPGAQLFQYLDDEQKRHPLTAAEVNAFIREVTGEDFTAKDFRTWTGTAEAYRLMKKECARMAEGELPDTEYVKSLRMIIKQVAEKLGNTVAVCRAHYIYGDLQKMYLSGEFKKAMLRAKRGKKRVGLKAYESELAVLLESLYKTQISTLR